MKGPESFEKLVAIMDRLRGPGGCPWDLEQSYESLRGYLIEECYEVAEALDAEDPEGLQEELGDLLFQIVFLSRIAKEEGKFTVDDVVRGIARKMVRRHPHVFGDAKAETSAEVLVSWEAIKREEKRNGDVSSGASVLDGLPRVLPALLKAQRLGTKAARVGFDWSGPGEVLDKVGEELNELRQALDRDDSDAAGEELGDLLFSLAMFARHLKVDAEGALERANRKFVRRFQWIESAVERDGLTFEKLDAGQLERRWEDAKTALGGGE